MAEKRLFCFGLGFSAGFLADHLAYQGWQVTGTVRSAEKAEAMRASGLSVHVFDGVTPMDEAGERALSQASHVLSSVPPDAEGDPVLRHYGDSLCEASGLSWVAYLSTTGVYGDHGGGWVDETTPTSPVTERGERRQSAENAWFALYRDHGVPIHVFRLAGIYGPGRNVLQSLLAGQARRVALPGHVFSRIHVEDIVNTLVASMAWPRAGAIYNVCDDLPASQSEVTAYAAVLLGMEPPPEIPFKDADMSPMARSFYKDNKRVSNRLIREELGVELAFPDYRVGIKALAASLKG